MDLTIDAAYPGGNILVDGIEGDLVRLRPDLRDTVGWWFYWSFRVRGAAGRALRFRFEGRNPIGVRGPAVSLNDGATWTWLGADAVEMCSDGASFCYTFGPEANNVRFAFAIPYQLAELLRFIGQHESNRSFLVQEHCRTRRGRSVPRIHIPCAAADPKARVLLLCRHHCCESLASFALEGIIEEALSDTDEGRWLRQNAEILALPFMDLDGVEQGDQGKNRRPHDHNRDYEGESLYPEVHALRQFVPAWSRGRLRLVLDLHCPHIRGPTNEVIYLVGSANPTVWKEQCRFGSILDRIRRGPLPYSARNNLPYGQGWNTSAEEKLGKTAARWAEELPGVRLASIIEIPYANASGVEVNGDTARLFGHDLARSIQQYLAE